MSAARRSSTGFSPYVVLAACLVLTVGAATYAYRSNAEQDRLRFENAADRVKAAIENRLDAYLAMLLGGAGLFAASEDVTWQEFHAYVERLELSRRYPGIQGIGFSRVVQPDERAQVAAAARRYAPKFAFWPDQPDRPIHAIVFLEPLDEGNRFALGFDMTTEGRRAEAMARARDMGAPAATAVVTLVQERALPEQPQPGFLIYVPVYRGGEVPVSVEDRRAQLLGFVYCPFRGDDLLAGILGSTDASGVVFDLFDGRPQDGTLLHQSASTVVASRFGTVRPIDVAGRRWTLMLRSAGDFGVASGRTVVRLTGAGGLLLSILLFAFMRAEARARDAAERTAEDLRQSEDALRAANRSKDEFLAVISHELRTPLNAIVGWSSMLKRGQVPQKDYAHALEVIDRNAMAQTRLVEDLLDLSRAIAGRLGLKVGDVEIASVLAASVDAVKPNARAHGVEVELRRSGDLGTIRGDAARLQQVVMNLLANSIKFTPSGGRIVAESARSDGAVIIKVSDTGIGIEPAFLPFVFDHFRQADSSTTRSHGGVGLGLAIVRHLVELHRGTVEAFSEGAGKGSTFVVTLPAAGPGQPGFTPDRDRARQHLASTGA